jgi:hypothetical protein
MTSSRRLTPVQQDVLDRLRDGWSIREWYALGCTLHYSKDRHGPAPRHVSDSTVESLQRHGVIRLSGKQTKQWRQWVLA